MKRRRDDKTSKASKFTRVTRLKPSFREEEYPRPSGGNGQYIEESRITPQLPPRDLGHVYMCGVTTCMHNNYPLFQTDCPQSVVQEYSSPIYLHNSRSIPTLVKKT